MAQQESQKRQHLIINYLRKNKKTFDEIKTYIENEFDILDYEIRFSKRTFQRDKISIARNFNIDIEYSKITKTYKIIYDEDNQASQRIIDAYNIANTINIGSGFSEYINFEERKSSGTDFMLDILTAIKNRSVVNVLHRKYWEDSSTLREVEPYAIKEYKYRWYLVAKDINDNRIKNFGLDRITTIVPTEKQFIYPSNFNIKQYFSKYYGVITSDKEPDIVELSFTAFQGKYIKSLALHHSQKILVDNDDELIISLKLVPTIDFIMDLQYYGECVKVLKPKWLADDIMKNLTLTQKQYE